MFSNVHPSTSSGFFVQMFKCSNVQMFKCSNVQINFIKQLLDFEFSQIHSQLNSFNF